MVPGLAQDQYSWGEAETDGMGQQEKALLVEGTARVKPRRRESTQRMLAGVRVTGL